MRALVSGGAGFLGSHLCERLLDEGWEVRAVDNLATGAVKNVVPLKERKGFRFTLGDVTDPGQIYRPMAAPYDAVIHLASIASPPRYQAKQISTLRAGAVGTENLLNIADRDQATFLLASTSEVYGNPEVHPQTEEYNGNVNPTGPRSMYDESKRYAEALTMAAHREWGLQTRIARIFNTYGPRMARDDGRVVSTFVDQALRGQPLTVHGSGQQTRSLCYVDDLVEGLWRLLQFGNPEPFNIGNPHEMTVTEIAQTVDKLVGNDVGIRWVPRQDEDPDRRRPDIRRAQTILNWHPEVDPTEGLSRMVEWARREWK